MTGSEGHPSTHTASFSNKKWRSMLFGLICTVGVATRYFRLKIHHGYENLDEGNAVSRRTSIETSMESPWSEVPMEQWCVAGRGYPRDAPTIGFIYVKVYKTSSSTSAGVALRISKEAGQRFLPDGQSCALKYKHGLAWMRNLGQRVKGRSFMWSMVRDPSKRAISHVFFFTITQSHREPTDELVINGMQRATPEGRGGFQVNYLSTYRYEENLSSRNLRDVEIVVDRILEDYDFLGVAERYDESMVALRLLLGLETSDMMHLNSKTSGGYTMKCNKIVKSFTTEAVEAYMESEDWKERNVADRLLVEAANRKLDRTIESIGRERFEMALTEHRNMMKLVEDRCEDKAIFPCMDGINTAEEAKSNCYSRDFGCGYPCIDEMLREEITST